MVGVEVGGLRAESGGRAEDGGLRAEG